MKLKTLVIVMLSLLLTTSVMFGEEAAEKTAKPEKCPGKVKVLVEKVTPQEFVEYKLLKKRALPLQEYEIAAKAAGTVKKIEKAAGTAVKAGEVILLLDTAKIEKDIETAKADAAKWKRILWKRQHWKDRSERAEKQAQANLDKADKALEVAGKNLAACTITAPADGQVASVKANEGDLVSEGFVVVNIVDVSKMKLVLTTYADKVSEGQALNVKIKELSTVVEGTVKKGETTDVVIDNADGKIKIGMTGFLKALVDKYPNAIAIDKKYIGKDDAGLFVYLVNGKWAKKTVLKIGSVTAGKVHVKEGVKDGDEVIVAEVLSAKEGSLKKGLPCLEDGKKIQVVEKNAAGKYVKRKAVKGAAKVKKPEVKKEKPVKKEEPKPKKAKKAKKVKKAGKVRRQQAGLFSSFTLGAHASYHNMLAENFSDVYGSMATFGLDFSVMLHENIDIWFSYAYGKKTAQPDWTDEELEFITKPFAADIRYYFTRTDKFDFFGGAGLSVYAFEDRNPIEDVSDTAVGFNILAGTYYHLTEKFLLQFSMRYNMVTKTIEGADEDLDLNSLELLFGLSYRF